MSKRRSYKPSLPRCEVSRKVCYPSKAKAEQKARTIKNVSASNTRVKTKGSLRAYFHEACQSWHLTSLKNSSEKD